MGHSPGTGTGTGTGTGFKRPFISGGVIAIGLRQEHILQPF
tara:strand:+ start:426 stop:548 length:123 start_codon:yes stop_codon:yes gene_type:complete